MKGGYLLSMVTCPHRIVMFEYQSIFLKTMILWGDNVFFSNVPEN